MELTIVTGLSGAGKTQALRFFEDIGCFCIDNLPPVLLPKLMEMYMSIGDGNSRVVLVIDARVGTMIAQVLEQVRMIKQQGHECNILFLEADDETLVGRYKETRRSHPLETNGGLLDSIKAEREMLRDLYNSSDIVVDTSGMKMRDLYEKLRAIYVDGSKISTIRINVMAFGFKYGAPSDADLIFDVRCLPNPFYVEELKHKTGNDKEVQDYVMQHPESVEYLQKLEDMMEFLVPLNIKEGKLTLTVAIGCTGGKHRSVTFANRIMAYLEGLGYNARCVYRDIEKE
ncbi:MAG: RNase adapter RapZ [Clostridia bacterium]|nr:RNase adapter RapZ [Clostridia bacterium]